MTCEIYNNYIIVDEFLKSVINYQASVGITYY